MFVSALRIRRRCSVWFQDVTGVSGVLRRLTELQCDGKYDISGKRWIQYDDTTMDRQTTLNEEGREMQIRATRKEMVAVAGAARGWGGRDNMQGTEEAASIQSVRRRYQGFGLSPPLHDYANTPPLFSYGVLSGRIPDAHGHLLSGAGMQLLWR